MLRQHAFESPAQSCSPLIASMQTAGPALLYCPGKCNKLQMEVAGAACAARSPACFHCAPTDRTDGVFCRVEYFGVKLEGFAFTENGWVQSYGSRYVRPPIIYGDVSRTGPITVKEFKYAQSLTQKPVKGMLTGETRLPPNSACYPQFPARALSPHACLRRLNPVIGSICPPGVALVQPLCPGLRGIHSLRACTAAMAGPVRPCILQTFAVSQHLY